MYGRCDCAAFRKQASPHKRTQEVPYVTVRVHTQVAQGRDRCNGRRRSTVLPEAGWYQKQYRKRKNSIESAILERAQNDPRFKDLVAGVTKEVVDSFGK